MNPHPYTPELLKRMADQHDAHSVCTQPARDHFAEVCRAFAATLTERTEHV
jgi:hypothetical protein